MLSSLRTKDKLFYGWMIVVAFLIIGTINLGIRFSYGVFFKPIEGDLHLTRAVTSGVLSMSALVGFVFAVLHGWASDKYGPRIIIMLAGLFTGLGLLLTSQTNSLWQLFITYSFKLSIGLGATNPVTVSTISRWFDKKRGLALGIAGAGAGLGPLIMAPFATYLISEFDWRIAFIVIGLIAWVVLIPISRLLKKDPQEIGVLSDRLNSSSKDIKDKKESVQPINFSFLQVLKIRNFWFLISMWLFFGFNLLLVLTHIVPHVTDLGFSAGEAATVLSMMGGMSIGGKVLMGKVSDNISRRTAAIICALLQGGATIWLIWSQDLWMFYLFAAAFGFAYGGIVPVVAALTSDIFGLRNIGTIIGVLNVGWGLGAAIGPAVGGYIFDVRDSYFIAFLLGGIAMLIAALIVALVRTETGSAKQILEQEML